MKKQITLLFIVSITFLINAQVESIDTLNMESKFIKRINLQEKIFNQKLLDLSTFQKNQFDSVSNELYQLTNSYNKSQSKLDNLSLLLLKSEGNILELEKQITFLESQIDSKVKGLQTETSQLGVVTNNLSEDLTIAKKNVSEIAESASNNSNSINTVSQDLSQKQQYGIIFLGLFLILVLIVYVILTKKRNQDTKKLAAKQQEIFEKQIQDSQQLADWLSKESATMSHGNKEIDHSFAKRVADEIVRITTNLSRMDASIKGYKQLAASVRKLEQSLNANHYQLEELLNKPYDNGMNLQANFVTDDNLKEGESTITRVIKPQINFKGKLIQAAQVEVSVGE